MARIVDRRIPARSSPVVVLLGLLVLCTAARAENWPRFRGPTGQGVSAETSVPVKWGPGENVAWKVEVPGLGWSSPVVWEERVFVTSAAEDGASCRVVCVNKADGKLLWDTEVFRQETRRKENKNSYATPTPVTDGQRVYAVFGGGGIAAVDFEGKVAWTNQDYPFYSQHGLGASPLLYQGKDGGLLVMPFDGSSPGDDKTVGWKKPWGEAFIVALDVATGKEKWKARRGMSRIAHVTPQVADVGGKAQLVSGAGDVVQGFDPETGGLVWTVRSQGEGVVPSVVVGEGLAFTSSGFEAETVRAVKLDPAAKGDVTATHLAWEQKRAVPTQPSLLYHGGLLFSVKENGIALCLEAKTGEVVWQERLEGDSYSASPVWAEGRLYVLAEDGTTTVIEAGRTFKEIASNALDVEGRCQASPAISGGNIFIRSERHLYCIGKP